MVTNAGEVVGKEKLWLESYGWGAAVGSRVEVSQQLKVDPSCASAANSTARCSFCGHLLICVCVLCALYVGSGTRLYVHPLVDGQGNLVSI